MTKKKKPDADAIISKFMTAVLEEGKYPSSVYKFCKEHGIDESDFYQHFGSIETLKQRIWIAFYQNTSKLLEKNKAYEGLGRKEKLLTFYYTFFELLGLNRSYILFALGDESQALKAVPQLKGFRKHFLGMIKELVEEGNAARSTRIGQMNPSLVAEGAWLQMLFLLRFWIRDDSPGFERTDMAIEKSVNTVFDVFDNTPVDSIIDFGKFLLQGQRVS